SQSRELRVIQHQGMRAIPVELTDHLTQRLIPEYEAPLRPGSDRLDGWAFVGLDAALGHRRALACLETDSLDSGGVSRAGPFYCGGRCVVRSFAARGCDCYFDSAFQHRNLGGARLGTYIEHRADHANSRGRGGNCERATRIFGDRKACLTPIEVDMPLCRRPCGTGSRVRVEKEDRPILKPEAVLLAD